MTRGSPWRPVLSSVALGFFVFVGLASDTRGAWGPAGIATANAPLGCHTECLVSDGAGGVIVTYTLRVDRYLQLWHLYARRFTAYGESFPSWPDTGTAICGAWGDRYLSAAVPAGDGSFITVWNDSREHTFDLYVQKLDASGRTEWTADGVPISSRGNSALPQIARDASSGAFIGWYEIAPDGHWELRLLRITGDGRLAPGWPDSGKVVAVTDDQGLQCRMTEDGFGGVLVAWAAATVPTLYCQRYAPDGTVEPGWPVSGTILCSAPGPRIPGVIVPAGDGGALVAWQDGRSDAGDVYVARVTGAGELSAGSPPDATPICTAAGEQGVPSGCPDGAGGLVLAWSDYRAGDPDLYAARVTNAGAVSPGWPTGGVAVNSRGSTASGPPSGFQDSPVCIPDGTGGAYIAWSDDRHDPTHSYADVYAARIDGGGTLATGWPTDGLAVSSSAYGTRNLRLLADDAGGAYCGWDEGTYVLDHYRPHLQRLTSAGQLAPPAPAKPLTVRSPSPNPSSTGARVVFSLMQDDEVELEVYEVSGRATRHLAPWRNYQAGDHSIQWDGLTDAGSPARPGLYLVSVRSRHTEATTKLLIVR